MTVFNPIEKVIHLLTDIKGLLEESNARESAESDKLDLIMKRLGIGNEPHPDDEIVYLDADGYQHIELNDANEPDMVSLVGLNDGLYNADALGCVLYADCTVKIADGIAYALVKYEEEQDSVYNK